MGDGDDPAKLDQAEVGRIFREESGRSVATLIGVFGDIDLAEDAVQEAFAVALRRWPVDGLPPNPGGWITTTARNRAIDRLRRESRGRELLSQVAVLSPGDQEADGSVVLLGDQDRTRWDQALIAEGRAILRRCLRRDQPGPYQLQAAINAVHADAPTLPQTDWPQILALYDQLLAVAPTPVVALNRAVAVGEVHGPAAALALVEELELDGYHLFHATRADLLGRLGRHSEAAAAYQRAAALAPTDAERAFLRRGGRAGH